MAYNSNDTEDNERVPQLEKEITRLQELCRANFGVIANLKKENQKLKEIQMELKDTTTDLAYSLAEYPWWGNSDQDHTLNAFRVLVTYTKNIQYILQLPIFFDPIEQLQSYGLNEERAIQYLRRRYDRKRGGFKCPKCKKNFTSDERRKKHLEFHTNTKKKLHCTQCNKYIQTFPLFKSHLQSHEFTNRMMAFPSLKFQKDPLPDSNNVLPQPSLSWITHDPSLTDKHTPTPKPKETVEELECEDFEMIPTLSTQIDSELNPHLEIQAGNLGIHDLGTCKLNT